jgi:competence protein ComEA
LIDLNRASVVELTRLPGIGQKRAEAIIAFRESHGGFQSVTQLLKIKGIGRAMLRKLRLLVTISGEPRVPRDTALATAKPAPTGSHGIHQVR